MNKTLKLFSILLMVVVMISVCTPVTFAAIPKEWNNDVIGGEEPDSNSPNYSTADGVLDAIDPSFEDTTSASSQLVGIANKILGLIQIASAVAAAVLVAVFGFKFIMGSANEKADYQKAFIPLIVGVVVVFSASSIAKVIFALI